jgi:hypothetical protein
VETKKEWIVSSYVYKTGYIAFGYIYGSHRQNLPFYLWNVVWFISKKIFLGWLTFNEKSINIH